MGRQLNRPDVDCHCFHIAQLQVWKGFGVSWGTTGGVTTLKLNVRSWLNISILLSPPVGKRGVLKRPWSEAERAAVEEHLTRNITELRVPAKADCERCLQQCPLLVSNHRDWRAIKFYCHNRIQLLKKNQRRENEPQPLTVC